MKETSLWYLLVPVALVLASLGVFLASLVLPFGGAESQCHTAPAALGIPASPSVVGQAINDLNEEGVISSPEDALNGLSKVGWVFDPDDGHRLEYWLTFGTGRAINTVGFNVICISSELTMVWEYDGLQALPHE